MTKTEFEIYAVKTAKEFLEAEYTEKQTILSYKKRFPNIEQALEKFEALKNDDWESVCLIIVRDRTSCSWCSLPRFLAFYNRSRRCS